jgi:hypothetical protein
MTIPLYHAVASVAPDPAAIFTRAQTVWIDRATPPYESFTLPCQDTFLAQQCEAGAVVQFIVRLADGRTSTHTLATDGHPSTALMRGGYAFGPAGAPFGFFRRAPVPGATSPPSPPNLAPDPFATIAVVAAIDRAYAITLAGVVTVRGRPCYHLHLRPLRDPQTYPLRQLWVDTTTYDVVRLVYTWPYNTITADVTYDFAPVGPNAIWTIVHIDAQAVSHALFSARVERVGEDLQNIEFPSSEPDSYFSP